MFPENVEDGEEGLVGQKNVFDQNNQSVEIVKIANDFITLSKFDHLLSQTLTKFYQL
jgi:hypothetical protein